MIKTTSSLGTTADGTRKTAVRAARTHAEPMACSDAGAGVAAQLLGSRAGVHVSTRTDFGIVIASAT